jgi:urocanate hydratase
MEAFSIADLQLKVTAASGTTPTMDVYVQKLLPDGSTWDDIAHFTQQTTTSSNIITLVAGNQGVHVQSVRTQASGSVRTTHFGNTWRIDVVISGTNPSFTWALFGDFYV